MLLRVRELRPFSGVGFSCLLVANYEVENACPPCRNRFRRSKLANVRLASWNIGSLTGKSIELVKILLKRRISIACIQETRWVGAKAKEIDGFKLWYSGFKRTTNGVGILVKRDLVEQVVEAVSYTHLTLPTKRIV